MNSSLNDKADALLQHSSHNIGVAMATPSGLVVPNIKHVQQRNVASIAAELVRLQKDAAIGRMNQSDVMGGTISISNIGSARYVGTFVLITVQYRKHQLQFCQKFSDDNCMHCLCALLLPDLQSLVLCVRRYLTDA